MRLRRNVYDNNEGNIFWITMTDLMTGLVLVFVVLFFYTYVTSHLELIKQKLAKENATKLIEDSLKAQNIEATVDSVTGIVKIADMELFRLFRKPKKRNGASFF